jgi:predicted Zn-dependent peptidase
MNRRKFCNPPRLPLVAGLLLSWLLALSANGQKVNIIEHSLPNGFQVLMVERHDDPTIAGGWVVHVGSANERPGITGIAHLFEHMMFKGTPTLGTKDYARDLQIIAEQERVRELMRKEESRMRVAFRRGEIDDLQKPENKSTRYKELEKEFNNLLEKQRQILVKNEFDRVYTTGGGSGMNAFTSMDITGYFITVPANKLELWMWMESERLLRPVFREFYAERDVVFEERRMRTESTPLGKFDESLEAMIWTSHPYLWPTVGWPSDIPAISKKQADEFYSIYYAPQNITLILVGDIHAETAVPLLEKYFGRIPRGKIDAPEVVTTEIPQVAERRMYGEAEANPQVEIHWHTVPWGHRDSYALTILSQILATRTGRLYKGLVLGSQVATEVQVGTDHRKYAGKFGIAAEARETNTPEQVEQGIYKEIDRLKAEDVPEQELQKVKNNFAAGEYRRLTSNMSILNQIILADGMGDWREINEAGLKRQAVTAADVRRVVNKYFTRESRNVAIYTRKAAKSGSPGPAYPEIAGLPVEQQKAFMAAIERIKQEKDAAKLKDMLGAVEKRAAGADPKIADALNLHKKLIQQRLEELK